MRFCVGQLFSRAGPPRRSPGLLDDVIGCSRFYPALLRNKPHNCRDCTCAGIPWCGSCRRTGCSQRLITIDFIRLDMCACHFIEDTSVCELHQFRLHHHHHHHHHPSLNREGRWGTTDDFATSFLYRFKPPLLMKPMSLYLVNKGKLLGH